MNETLIASGLQNICVYCGSGPGRNPAYAEAARELGQRLAAARIGLVYGGGSLGLMGEVARSVLDHGGHVTGIIPGFLSEREHMLVEAQELIVVDDMHQRKQLMFVRSDAFVALPGGLGTLEEFVEQLTWSQLGRHRRPIVLSTTPRGPRSRCTAASAPPGSTTRRCTTAARSSRGCCWAARRTPPTAWPTS